MITDNTINALFMSPNGRDIKYNSSRINSLFNRAQTLSKS